MDSLVNEDDEWEWYEEEDEQQQTNDDSAKNTETTNAETIFAQRRKSSCKVDTMFTFNQVQTKVAEISTSNHNMIPPSTELFMVLFLAQVRITGWSVTLTFAKSASLTL